MSLSDLGLDPWIGPNYFEAEPKVMVIGESRYDDTPDFTDRKIVECKVNGQRHHTFTNFAQACTGLHNKDSNFDAARFWNGVVFYNYNRTAFPGKAQVRLTTAQRKDPLNQRCLLAMLREFSPTHCVVWGVENCTYLEPEGCAWTELEPIDTESAPGKYLKFLVDGRVVLFCPVKHPSVGFSAEFWHPVLAKFFRLTHNSGSSAWKKHST